MPNPDNQSVRNADAADTPRLAKLWFDGWHDGHAQYVPAALTKLRTLDDFAGRLEALLPTTRVIERDGELIAFHIIRSDEVYQFYVDAKARGSGVAGELMRDAENQLLILGCPTAWLACAKGNDRAARFYEKAGWRRAATIDEPVQTSAGPFTLVVWRYEKTITDN